MNGVDNVLAATVFTPVAEGNPIAFYCRNCTGVVGAASDTPLKIGVGHYQVTANDSFINTMMNITARAFEATGVNRRVTVVPSAPLGNRTAFDIFIRTDAGVLSDDALFVEMTVGRLPL